MSAVIRREGPFPPGVTPAPLYQQVADKIREKITTRALKPGDPVALTPACGEYDVSRRTAQSAFRVLAREGLIKRYPGAGYTVQEKPG